MPIDGSVYAQPLVVKSQVIVASETDTVTAVDVDTGKVNWSRSLGTPVPGSSLPCGNIDPSGITGTPVADPMSGKLWVVASLAGNPAATSGGQPPATALPASTTISHVLFTISLSTGAVLAQRPIDPSGADPTTEQQRGALALANGYVYVPFGGLFGDCGAYHGYVVGVPISGSAPAIQFEADAGNGAGIWYPAGPAVVGSGELLVATGNGTSNAPDQSNSVLLLSQQLGVLGLFTPTDSASLSSSDLDLGSTDPIEVGDGHVFIAGKQGVGYLLAVAHLGGTGGQLFAGQVCNGGGQAIGGSVYVDGKIVVSCTNGLVALTLQGTGFSPAWTAGTGLAGPPIVSGGHVWFVDIDAGSLVAVDPGSGRTTQVLDIGAAVHLESPAAADGKIYVVAGGKLQAFDE